MTTITVTNLNDSGAGSLRAALASAGDGDRVTFASGLSGGVLRLSTELVANTAVTIDGDLNDDGRPDITITGDKNGDDILVSGSSLTDVGRSIVANRMTDNVRVLYANDDIRLEGLTLTGGRADFGGAVYTVGELSMENMLLAGNWAIELGGGFVASGSGKLSDTVISGNVSQVGGGGFFVDSGTLINVTVAENWATVRYGGIAANSKLELVHTTVTGNKADFAGGVASAQGAVTLTNSIVLGNEAIGAPDVSSAAPTVYQGLNIVGVGPDSDASDGMVNAPSLDSVFASVGANPFTGVTSGLLADNGGTLPSVALRPFSGNPAIDRAVSDFAPSTDGRGFARYDVPGYGTLADLGAFEAQNVGVPVNDAPRIALLVEDGAVAFTGVLRITVANDLLFPLTVTLSVQHGTLTLADLTTVDVVGGANGTASVTIRGAVLSLNDALGGLVYKPEANFATVDTLTISTTDGNVTDVDTTTLFIQAVNDPPVVQIPIGDQSIAEDAPWSYWLPAGVFRDMDNGGLYYTATLADGSLLPSWLSFNWLTETFSGAPPANFNGAIDIAVHAFDGEFVTSDVFRLTITAVNDAPIAASDAVVAVEGETPQGNVLTNDGDIDAGQSLTVVGIVGGTVGQELVGRYGALTLQADGSYTYAAGNTTLPEGETATETFTYTVSDGNGGTATADLVVTVTGGNPPFGNNAPNLRGTIDPTFEAQATGDFDGNGRLDVVWRSTTTNAVELWSTGPNGAITKTSLGTLGANWVVEGVGNLDGRDGDDIVFRDGATGATGAWLMRGGAPSDWRSLDTLGSTIAIAGMGDFDGNGIDDLLLVDTATRAVDVALQTATGPGAPSTVGLLPVSWSVVGIGDLDGNGVDDVLLFNTATRQLGAWQMSGGKPAGWFDYGTLASGWGVTEIGDFNGTGADDIGFYNQATGADGAWEMKGGQVAAWRANAAHDDLDPIGAGRFASGSTDQILWHNPITGAVVTF